MTPPSSNSSLPRRALLLGGTSLGLGGALGACKTGNATPDTNDRKQKSSSVAEVSAVLSEFELGAPPWRTFDPFLFCVHHKDAFPSGNQAMGPDPQLLAGRNIGRDFGGKDGWNMYHGDVVPGFPRHPHRGFETVTITRHGYVDHSDSLGATARYGQGDVQWMTAGRGIVHAEMFPLLATEAPNRAELFQLWLNLPRADKFATPHFSMFWHPQIPVVVNRDTSGRKTEVTVIAGQLEGSGATPPSPPPHSWAHNSDHAVAIWSVRMEPHAEWELPPAPSGCNRTLYHFAGTQLAIGAHTTPVGRAIRLNPTAQPRLRNSGVPCEFLLLQGHPIDEPIVKHGPFVMNEKHEINQAISDYRKTQFGGWPWAKSDPVHTRDSGRFAIHANGRREKGV